MNEPYERLVATRPIQVLRTKPKVKTMITPFVCSSSAEVGPDASSPKLGLPQTRTITRARVGGCCAGRTRPWSQRVEYVYWPLGAA
jgi:hypothetical protein